MTCLHGLDFHPELVLNARRHVVQEEAKWLLAARIATYNLPVVILWMVVERVGAVRASVNCGDASELCAGKRAHAEHHEPC